MKDCNNSNNKNKLIENQLDLPTKIFAQLRHQGIKIPHELEEDLSQEILLAIVQSAKNFDPKKGTFEAKIYLRTRGAILDFFRRSGYLPRKKANISREIERIRNEIEQEEGRPARHTEITKKMGISFEKYSEIFSAKREKQSNTKPICQCRTPEEETIRLDALDQLYTQVTNRQQEVLPLLLQGMKLREIAKEISGTTSNVGHLMNGIRKTGRELFKEE